MTIGERIKQKRLELNMSQDELGKKVGYKSRSSIQKIEAARNLPLSKVSKMASALNTTPAYLMGWEDEESGDKYIVEIEPAKSMEEERAKELWEMYSSASPDVQSAVRLLLKLTQSDS